MEHDVSRVLMAVAHLLGAWDGEMLIPWSTRPPIVERRDGDHHWKLDERGYPCPSPELLRELDYLYRSEQSRKEEDRLREEELEALRRRADSQTWQ